MNQLCYLAAPFFNPKQLALVELLEGVIVAHGWDLFSPRLAKNALALNAAIKAGEKPTAEMRELVFQDNVDNIDRATLMLAVIDDRDTGVMFEIGYAYRADVPVVTYSGDNHGVNLMLANSIIGHVKTPEQAGQVLHIGRNRICKGEADDESITAVAAISKLFMTEQALLEGPAEHKKP